VFWERVATKDITSSAHGRAGPPSCGASSTVPPSAVLFAFVNALGIHHVTIIVSDMDAAVGFYRDVLGLSERTDRTVSTGHPRHDDHGTDGAWLDAGHQHIHLAEGSVPPDHGQHFALLVHDLGATIEELRSSGVEVGEQLQVGAAAQAFLHDPAGNLVELHEAPRYS
jgi:glyoxylase I family protein